MFRQIRFLKGVDGISGKLGFGFGLAFFLDVDALVILLINVFVQDELTTDGIKGGAIGFDLEVHEVTAGHVTWAEGELAFAEVVDLFELGARLFEVTADACDELFDGFFFALHVEDNHGFVFAFHLDVEVWFREIRCG